MWYGQSAAKPERDGSETKEESLLLKLEFSIADEDIVRTYVRT